MKRKKFEMIITYQDFIDSGMRVSSDISESEITNAISTVENFYVKTSLTDEHFIDLCSQSTTDPNKTLVKGGIMDGKQYAGLKMAEYHLVYAYLMTEQQRITRYSTVDKNSEYSKNTDRDDVLEQARVHWDIGMSFLAEVQTYFGIDTTHNKTNNLFETIVW